MIIRSIAVSRYLLAGGLIALAVAPASSQQAAAPVARYTMDAGTTSGMAAMGQAASGGGIGGALAMMRGGGNQVGHELLLKLGSTRPSTGTARGDHFMPVGAQLGASLPLVFETRTMESTGGPAELPRGRLLMFWGCGENAGAGQPVVVDFARLARGEIPPGLFAQGLDLPDDWRITPSNSNTYGDWPNRTRTLTIPGNSSLVGAHRVASPFAPEISFNLAEDYMPALRMTGRDQPGGAMSLSWNALPKATGYYAWGFGEGQRGNDVVWWTSANSQQFGGPFGEWLSPSTARRYVESGALLAPATSECTVPKQVKAAIKETMITSLYAYGPQVDFSYPPRPRNARAGWQPEWIARVRFRSMTSYIPGMDGMMDGGDNDSGAADPNAAPAIPRCRGGLRGLADRAAGKCR